MKSSAHRVIRDQARSNEPLRPGEEDTLRKIQTECLAELLCLEKKVEECEASLDRTKARRNDVAHTVEAAQSRLSSPFGKALPTEILATIFTYATEGEAVTLEVNQGIWAFSKVCQGWRYVALSTPFCWMDVRIVVAELSPNMKSPVELLRCILYRSRNHPLFVAFHNNSMLTYRDLFCTLLDHAPRWVEADLFLNDTLNFYLSGSAGRFSRLERLSIDMGMNEPDGCEGHLIAFRDAPALYEVRLSNADLYFTELPWEQITHLCIVESHRNSLRPILQRAAPSLVALYIVSNHYDRPFMAPGIIDMLSLEYLQIEGVTSLPEEFNAPNLKHCICRVEGGEAGEVFQMIQELLAQSKAKLDTLVLAGDWTARSPTYGALFEILRGQPTVKMFTFDNSGPASSITQRWFVDFLFKMSPSLDDRGDIRPPELLPQLRCLHLDLGRNKINSTSNRYLQDMLSARVLPRMRYQTPLKRVKLVIRGLHTAPYLKNFEGYGFFDLAHPRL